MSKSKSPTGIGGLRFVAIVIGSVLASFAAPVNAQAIEEIEKSQTNTAVLKAKIEEIKASQELEALKSGQIVGPTGRAVAGSAGHRGRVGGAGARGFDDGSGENDSPALPVEIPPQVLAIFGVNKSLYASLVYPNGVRQDVRAGDDIEGGYRVKSITPSRVTLSKEGKMVPLRIFAGMTADKEPSARAPRR